MTEGRPVWFATSRNITHVILPSDAKYLMLTLHVIVLKDPGLLSTHIHVSTVHRRVERTSALYVQILMSSDKRQSCHMFDKGAIIDEANSLAYFDV